MTPAEAKQVIDLLARGIDPATGEALPDNSPLNGAHIIRALFIASKALEPAGAKPVPAGAGAAGKAGKPWSDDEDQRLLTGFDAGTPLAQLATAHERTRGAINSRLIRLGRLQIHGKAASAPNDQP